MTKKAELQKKDHSSEVASPTNLIEMAISKGADIEQLEKLMQLQERWEKKEASKAFKLAMSAFQAKKPKLIKSSSVSFGNTKYNFISLSDIQKAIDGILSKCGMSYRWEQESLQSGLKITCVVSHVDGHEERTYLSAPLDVSGNKNSIQSIGSTVSYLKRYTLEGALGLSSSNDDDGNTHADKPKGKPFISEERYKDALRALSNGKATKELILESYQITEIQEKTIDSIVKAKTNGYV